MHSLLITVLMLIFIAGKPYVSESRVTRDNYCPKTIRYVEEIVVPETKTVTEPYKTYCWHYTLRCEKLRSKTITVNKTISVIKTKTVFDCCPGYKKENEVCIPICKLDCYHGNCVKPGICLCDPGWRGPFCQIECEPNQFGRDCKDNCTCLNGAKCDQETGFCHCTEGYTGDECQLPCSNNTFGQDCNYNCQCKNEAICDNVNGTCDCTPGYEGEFCEELCENGTYGQYCEEKCICFPQNTELCHHVDGKCACLPGYGGEFCEKECDDFTYGPNCSEKCLCLHSEFCDNINGECHCKPGWTGATCSEKCPKGKFGENCTFECTQCLNISGHCDQVTGVCNCPSGFFGDRCEKGCLPGFWGSNCSKICSCTASQTCNPKNGFCSWNYELYTSDSMDYQPSFVMIIATLAGCFTVVLVIGVMCWRGYRQKDLELTFSPPVLLPYLLRRIRCKRNDSRISGAVINNPVYEFNEVVLESNPRDSIRVSLTNGVKYVKKNPNNLCSETKLTNMVKTDKVTGGIKGDKSDPKDTGNKKTHSLSSVFKDVKRCSLRKTDPIHSSTNELENDFQPEILEDFNVMENMYDSITKENIYDKPIVVDDKNLSLKE